MSERPKAYEMREIRCTNCTHYLGTLKIMVDPSRMTYDDEGKSKEITIAEFENLHCKKCKQKTDMSIVIGRKVVTKTNEREA